VGYDPNNIQDDLTVSRDLIARAKIEREHLLRQIEDSQKIIDRSRELIAQIDEMLAWTEKR
jgi:hypothetical protein